jgi:hypothetical protein
MRQLTDFSAVNRRREEGPYYDHGFALIGIDDYSSIVTSGY